ncbi:hypothetical protein [Pedobacter sp. JCM 36344]|uniref:hypothetical protein n=1 Tax=Pedobacter sp. JCM 36344 TaxID=3374280 RepID=UPI00397B0A72
MKISYFKPRKPFDFSAHTYDIGVPIGFWKDHDDNHFLLKLYKLDEQLFAEYYKYHLSYTLENNIGSEEDFFQQVWQLVKSRIKHYEKQSPFSRNHATHVQSIAKLQQFQKYLNGIDQWNARPSQIVIAEKEEIIQQQKIEIEKLQKRLAELNEYEVAQKIRIEDDYLPTVIDLIKQMRELELPSGRKLLRSDHKNPYQKMVSKYFSHGEKDIPIETSRNYFVEKKGDVPAKGTIIQPEQQLFKIIPKK